MKRFSKTDHRRSDPYIQSNTSLPHVSLAELQVSAVAFHFLENGKNYELNRANYRLTMEAVRPLEIAQPEQSRFLSEQLVAFLIMLLTNNQAFSNAMPHLSQNIFSLGLGATEGLRLRPNGVEFAMIH